MRVYDPQMGSGSYLIAVAAEISAMAPLAKDDEVELLVGLPGCEFGGVCLPEIPSGAGGYVSIVTPKLCVVDFPAHGGPRAVNAAHLVRREG